MSTIDPIPQAQPLTRDAKGTPFYIDGLWLNWLYNAITVRLGLAIFRFGSVAQLTAQTTSLGATPLTAGTLSAGRYRISIYARITTADLVSSSLTVTIGWIESGQALTISGSAITGNATTSVQAFSVVLEVDGNSALTFSTAYVSNTPGQMVYRLTVVGEKIP